jgi:pimeloyl-ACP methyl ester carboxylesterase
VTDSGPVGGDPVVLLHGFPQRATSWRHVAPLLHAEGLRTYAPDLRGYSPGARPGRRRDYTVPRLLEDLAALVDDVGGPVHLVGHDWGAVVGWAAAARHPELLRTWTAVSVPHPRAFLDACVRGDQLLRSWYVGAFQLPWLPEKVLASPLGRSSLRRSGMSEEAVARFEAEVVGEGALTEALRFYRALPFTGPGAAARRVTVPTTLVWSDGDVALGHVGAERSGRYVDAPYAFVELEGVSHWIPEEAPRELADAVLARIGSA